MGWDPFKDIKKITGKVLGKVSSFAEDLTGINLLGKSMPVTTAGTLLEGVVQGATQTAGSTTPAQVLPGVTPAQALELDVPTASYLETQDYLAMQRQKALVANLKGTGLVSKQQGAAMARTEEPIDFSQIAIIVALIVGIKLCS